MNLHPPGPTRSESRGLGWSALCLASAAVGVFLYVAIAAAHSGQAAGTFLSGVFVVLSALYVMRELRQRQLVGPVRRVGVELNTTTPILGDRLTIRLSPRATSSAVVMEVLARLRCEFHGRQGTGREGKRRELLHELSARAGEPSRLASPPRPGSSVWEMQIDVPPGGPPSLMVEDNAIRWRLEVAVRLAGRKPLWLDPVEIVVRPVALEVQSPAFRAQSMEQKDSQPATPHAELVSEEAGGPGGSFQLRLDDRVVRAGERIEGKVGFLPSHDIDDTVLTARLAFATRGHGNPRIEQVVSQTIFTGAAPAGRRIDAPLRLEVPLEGPVSFETQPVSVAWEIQVSAATAGGAASGEIAHASFPIQVRPAIVQAARQGPHGAAR
jgi:hypothetical protein